MKDIDATSKDRDRFKQMNPEVGDKIEIKGRDHNWHAKVTQVNPWEGKVGIAPSMTSSYGDPFLDSLFGIRKRRRAPNSVCWIEMRFVLKVTKGSGVLRANNQE